MPLGFPEDYAPNDESSLLAQMLRFRQGLPVPPAPERQPRGIGGGPPIEELTAMLEGDEPSGAAFARALRGREAMGELGMAGSPAIREAAAPVLQGARQRLGEDSARKAMLLKRSLWQQGRAPAEMPDEAMLSAAEAIGIDRNTASMLTKPQLQGLLGSQAQRRAAEADKERRSSTPEAQADKAAKAEADRLEREAKRAQIDATRSTVEARTRENEGASLMGTDWTLGPTSPLRKDETLKRNFLQSATAAREMKTLAGTLRDMIKGGLGPTSSAEQKTKAASIVSRLQLLQKNVDTLGVLSAVDISEFVNPQLRNPTSFDSAWKDWAGLYDPAAQLDQYMGSMEQKVREQASAYDVQPTEAGKWSHLRGGKQSGGVRKFQRVNGKLLEVP